MPVPISRNGPLAGLFLAFFFYLGIQTPYFSPWLASRGIDRGGIAAIGSIVLIANTLGQLLLPVVGLRIGLVRVLTLAAVTALLATLRLMGAEGFPALASAAAVAGFCSGAVIPLADAEALRRRGLAYGQVRVFGSVGFAAAALTGGVLIDRAGLGAVIVLQAAALAVLIATTLPILAGPRGEEERRRLVWRPAGFAPLASRPLWMLIAAVALVNSSHAYYYLFANIDWSAHNLLSGAQLGVLWATGIASEILVMILFGRQESRRRALGLMLLGASGAALRWAGTALDPPFAVLCALQLLHGFSFAATLVGGLQFLRLLVPQAALPAALGLFAAMVHGVVIGIVTAFLGRTTEAGGTGYALMAALALAGGGLVLGLAWLTRDGMASAAVANELQGDGSR